MDGDKKDEPMDVEEKKEIAGSQVLRLPQKDHVPQSRGCFESEVRCNLFRMELDANMMVHKYRIDLKKIRKEQEYDLTKGIKSDVASQHRRRICQSIWSDFLKKCEKNGQPLIDDKYCLVYDCANILYAAKRLSLPLEGDCKVFGLALSREEVSSDNTRNYVGKQCEQIVVSIEHTLDFVYSTANEEDKHRETMQFLEVLTSASLNKIGDHFVFGNKYYAKSSRNDVPIGEGKSIKSGFEKSVRIGESEDGKPHCYVQIDAKKSPFFNGVAIPKFCAEYIGARDARDLEHISRSDKSKLNQQLKGLIARTIYTDKSKTRFINVNGLHNENANNTMFEYDGNQVSINDFFKDKYNYKLKYPHLPCIIEKDRQKMSLYPQEVLEIERGQRVSCQKSSRSMAENMIKECRMNPLELKEYIERAIKECLLDRDNRFLKNFKIKVENRWERVAAATLFPPAIKYKSNTVEPQSDGSMRDWNIRNATFLKGGVISKMVFVIFDRAVDKDPARFFLEKILREASNKGMRVPDSRHVEIVNCQSEIVKNLEDIYIDLKSEPHPYIFCVAKNKFDPVHALVKSLEAKHGVVTQQVCNQTLNKAIGQQGAFMVIGNLIQKLNPKAGGVNHAVGLSREHLRKNKNVTDPNLLHPSRMIFGFDISHAGPQSFADRALKIEQSEPSVVGMSFSLEHATHLGGTYWMQAPRFAGLSNVTDRVAKALQTRLKIVGSLPDDIIIYRGGVSEGEFPKVLQEVEQFQGAFQLLKKSPPYNPSVTCIVAMTNSNFRMLPTDINPRAKPHEQNVCSGTVVRTGVVNPQYNEFIIVPQKGIMGTIRPLRCVIVAAVQGSVGKCLNSDDAQQLTHALAYGHQVVNAPTTLPVPLTAATNLTKRGRNNYNEVNHRDQDARSALSGSSGETGQFRHDSTKDYFEKVTDSVKSKLEHHFWA